MSETKIVTLTSLPARPASPFESTVTGRERPDENLAAARYQLVVERLRRETSHVGPGLMVTVPDREVSVVQSELARLAESGRAVASGGLEVKFGTGITGGDWFGWLRSLFDHVDRQHAHPILRPRDAEAAQFPDDARVAITADWGTGLYGAPRIAKRIIEAAPFDLLLHLGDIYYSGTVDEINERFLKFWPREAGTLSRTLNSNHEMYSGGHGYFTVALPALGQTSSYFAFQNQQWLLAGLDTAFVDHDVDAQQVAWLNLVIDRTRQTNAGVAKKLVLFSHQQPFSRLDQQGPKLQEALRHLLESRAITGWYWGHEHQCVIYDQHPSWGFWGRCLGNGGIPEPRKAEVRQAPTERAVGTAMWKRMSANTQSPSCLVLDGPNNDVKGEEERFVPHGFMTLEFRGDVLVEHVFLSDGTEIATNTID